MLIPSVMFQARKDAENKDEKIPEYRSRPLEMAERTGRYGTMFFYVIRLGDIKAESVLSYIVPGLFLAAYIVLWILLWNRPGMLRAVMLSVLPSIMFLSSALIDRNWPLIAFLLLFAPAHITISIRSAEHERKYTSGISS